MDALYVLGNGSKFKNNEIRYSLRTLEKFIPTLDRVIVVGEDTGFFSSEVDFYKLPEFHGNKEFRIAKKIEWACKKDVVTEDFLFLNDDFFFTQTIAPESYPYYYKGTLKTTAPNGGYQKSLINTAQFLQQHKKTILHFDVHTPIIYNPEKFMALDFAWKHSEKLSNGLVVKSTYANMHGYNTVATRIKDAKLSRLRTPDDFNKINNRNVYSCSDVGWLRGIAIHLAKEYPNPSKYEK